jgi:hypothetical protein
MISIRATAVKPQRPIVYGNPSHHFPTLHLPSPPFGKALTSPQADLSRAAQDIRNCFVALSSTVKDRLVVVTSPTTGSCLPGLAE